MCKLAAQMLGLNLHVQEVRDDRALFKSRATSTQLSLLRIDTIGRANLLNSVYNDMLYMQTPVTTIASLHYESLSIVGLQRQLTSQLRDAVVFL